MIIDFQRLHEHYLKLNLPNPFSLQDIHHRLTTTYDAKQVDIHTFSDLQGDPHAKFETVVTAYTIREDHALKKLMVLNKPEDTLSTHELSLILNSEDQQYLSGGTLRGMSYLLALEVDVFWGIEKEARVLENEQYKEFLVVLYLTGYLSFANDPLIGRLRERYREGYYLKHYGVQDGHDNYLFDSN